MILEELKDKLKYADLDEHYIVNRRIAYKLLGKNVAYGGRLTGMVVGYWGHALIIGNYRNNPNAWSIECFTPGDDGVLLLSSPMIRYLEYIIAEDINEIL